MYFGGIELKRTARTCEGFKKLSVFCTNPKTPRTQFSNQQLPDMYQAAFSVLPKASFETYFRGEVTCRWEFHQGLQDNFSLW